MRSGATRNSAHRSARYIKFGSSRKRSSLQPGLIRNANPVRGGLLAAQQNPPAAVGVQPDPGELPSAVLGLDRQSGGCADPRQIRWQPQGYPLVLVGQIAVPALWHPAAVHRRHQPNSAPAITCTPAPEPDTTYRVPDASSKAREL